MVDNKDIENKNKDKSLDKDLDNKDNLREDLDFSSELSNLEKEIRNAAGDKLKEKEQEVVWNVSDENVSDELDSLSAEIILSGIEWGKVNERKDKVSEFFDAGQKEFEKVDTKTEKRVVKKHKNMVKSLSNRPGWVQEAIGESVDKILDEIYNWREEKNPVARSLLKIVNWIMKTEK
mgnify:CR=1 FL=1